MTNEAQKTDKLAFSWFMAYATGFLSGSVLLPAWVYYTWMEAKEAALQAGESIDDLSPMAAPLALVVFAVIGAAGGLVTVGLVHLVAALYGGFRRRHAQLLR